MIAHVSHDQALRERLALAIALRNLLAVYEVDVCMGLVATYPQPYHDATALLAKLEEGEGIPA